jgi:hypothetical protein
MIATAENRNIIPSQEILGGGGGSRTRVNTVDFITFFYTPFSKLLNLHLPHFYHKN